MLYVLKTLTPNSLTGIVEFDDKFFLESQNGKKQVANSGTIDSCKQGSMHLKED